MRRGGSAWVAALVALALAACEGSGSGGGGLEIRFAPVDPRCGPAGADFPSGLALLSPGTGLAALVQTQPSGLALYGIAGERPVRLAFRNFGTDSDADGVDDADAMRAIGRFPLRPVSGEIHALRDDLALVSTSNYEQVLVYDPSRAQPLAVAVATPASVPVGRYPLLPAPGAAGLRTGVSTLACVSPPDPFDSGGFAIGPDCDPMLPSYSTNLTAGKAVAGGRLFVATSNLVAGGGNRFRPGSVLVYTWSEAGGMVTVQPDVGTPVLFTSGFNPTGMTRFVTPGGRELALVTVTGAIGTGSGPGNVVTAASIDVIDPAVPRIAATFPLGLAGPSFQGPAVEPGGRVAWLGASSQRQLYAVDLRALDDPALYTAAGDPTVLDAAVIFDAARPLVLPDRADGPPASDCDGFTHVAPNTAGSEVYATDFCDGSFTRVRMDLSGSPPVPYPVDRFRIAAQSQPFAPNQVLGELRAPSFLAVRPGDPGVDFSGPDVFALSITGPPPEGHVCALRVESF